MEYYLTSELLFGIYMEAMVFYFYSSVLILLLAVHIQQMTENPSDDLQWSDSCLQETSWTSNGV